MMGWWHHANQYASVDKNKEEFDQQLKKGRRRKIGTAFPLFLARMTYSSGIWCYENMMILKWEKMCGEAGLKLLLLVHVC